MKKARPRPPVGKTLVVVAVLIAIAALLLAAPNHENAAAERVLDNPLDVSELGNRVLIVAPHPDDEGLATAGLIKRCLSSGKEVLVVLVTCGDGSKKAAERFFKVSDANHEDMRKLGLERSRETRNAMRALGLPDDRLIFLGYPDGGTNALWDFNWDPDNLHTGANGADHSPYPFAYQENAPYCGESLAENLESIGKEFKPTAVFYPDPADTHHDHWAVNAFVQYVFVKLGYRGGQYTYLVHYPYFPDPQWYCPNGYILPPATVSASGAPWLSLPLSGAEEEEKGKVIEMYTAPLQDLGRVMKAFVRRNELFGTGRVLHLTASTPARSGLSHSSTYNVNLPDPGYTIKLRDRGPRPMFEEVVLSATGDTATVSLVAKRPLDPKLAYIFHLRIFNRTGVGRLDILVTGTTECLQLAKNSIMLADRIPARFEGDRLQIEIPVSLFQDAGECMVSVDTVLGSERVRKTPYRRISLLGSVYSLPLHAPGARD